MDSWTKSQNLKDKMQKPMNYKGSSILTQTLIDELHTAKSEALLLIHQLSETKGTNKHLTEEVTKLKEKISELTFQDITDEMQLSASSPATETQPSTSATLSDTDVKSEFYDIASTTPEATSIQNN